MMKSKFIIALLPAALCLASCNNTLGKSFDFNKYEEYREKVVYANECLPTVNDLLQYEAVQFAYRKTSYFAMLGFQSEGISLFLDYNQENYDLEKEYIENKFTFIEEPVGGAPYYQFPVISFTYKDYDFRIAPKAYTDEEGKVSYLCKSFTMIGYNETLRSVAYLYFYDFDLDYLSEKSDSQEDINKRMPKLIEESFYWRK